MQSLWLYNSEKYIRRKYYFVESSIKFKAVLLVFVNASFYSFKQEILLNLRNCPQLSNVFAPKFKNLMVSELESMSIWTVN